MSEASLERLREVHARMKQELHRVIVGQEEVIDQLLVAILTRGHCLLVGVPGLAKTLMISSLSKTLDLSFSRIQFTPDLMPSDITGTELLTIDPETSERSFRFASGPLFANVVLADEINRTPPKTQAALLEAMVERQVTSAGKAHALPQPFFVLATQNPIEQEGTYPLPEAQLDRFMFKMQGRLPRRRRRSARSCAARPAASSDEVPTSVVGGEELLEAAGGRALRARLRRTSTTTSLALTRGTRVRSEDAAALPARVGQLGCGATRCQPVPRARREGATPRWAGRDHVSGSRTCAPSRTPCCGTGIVTNFSASRRGHRPRTTSSTACCRTVRPRRPGRVPASPESARASPGAAERSMVDPLRFRRPRRARRRARLRLPPSGSLDPAVLDRLSGTRRSWRARWSRAS